PDTGDTVVFPPSATRYESLNDITNLQLTSLLLTGGGYNLTGGAIKLISDLTDSHSAGGGNSIRFRIYFDGEGLVNVTGAQQGALLDLYEQIRMNYTTNLTLYVNAFDGSGNPGYLTLHDAIVSNSRVYKTGPG